jgi:hypothetical protein
VRPALWLLLTCAAVAQPAPTFRTDVSLVHLDAEVVSADGRLLTGFTRDDFRILDEGEEQPILYFSAGEEALDLVLLFDTSGSMKPQVQKVAAVRQSIEGDLLARRFHGATRIQSAILDAARLLRAQPRTGRRRAILIVTDNLGQRTHRERTLVDELWESDTVLTGLIVPNRAHQALHTVLRLSSPAAYALDTNIQGAVEKSGGDFLRLPDPAQAFTESMHRPRRRYTLYCAIPGSATAGQRRKLRATLAPECESRNPAARVRARAGYTVPAKAGGTAAEQGPREKRD